MRKTKEDRIKKLKKKHIWPSVVGLIVILFVFTIIMAVAVGMSAMDIVNKKLADSSRRSEKIAGLFLDYKQESADKITQMVSSHVDVLDEVEAVAVYDAERKPIWSSNDKYPALDDSIQMEFLTVTDAESIGVIIEKDDEQIFTVDDGMIVLAEDAFKHIFSLSTINETGAFANIKLWIVTDADDKEVMVLNNIPMYFQDFMKNGLDYEIPEGEAGADFVARCIASYQNIFENMIKDQMRDVAVVTHPGVILCLLSAMGVPKFDAKQLLLPPGTGWTTYITPEMWMRSRAFEIFEPLPCAEPEEEPEEE